MGLEFLDQERLTVSTSVGFTGTTFTKNALRAVVQHISGGEGYYTASGSAPSATGAGGEHLLRAEGQIIVKGFEDIRAFRIIKKSGDADCVINIRYEKIEGTG